MARYNIKSLNYVNVGQKRAFFNVDIEGDAISSNGCVFLAEFDPLDTQKKAIFSVRQDGMVKNYVPLYDIKDVSVKSTIDMGKRNPRIDAEDSFLNIYAPQLEKQPIGFCSVNEGQTPDTLMLTEPTAEDPYMYSSQLKYTRDGFIREPFAEILLESERSNMFLYAPPSSFGVSSYADAISSGVSPLSIFEPAVNIRGVEHNYVFDIPIGEIDSEYDTGNVHAGMFETKNQYNSTYTVEMPSKNRIVNARTYCGIGQTSNQIFLKFYDNVQYDLVDSPSSARIPEKDASPSVSKALPYQKVETFRKNRFSNMCNHKSNLFSIRIEDLDELSENTIEGSPDANDRRNVKDEVYSAIRDIVANVCPVNTQLFKVFFGI